MEDEPRWLKMQKHIDIYRRLNYYGTFFSSTMVLHTGTKAIFNVFAETKMPFDKWTIIDIVSSLMSILAFNQIDSLSVAKLENKA